MRHTAVSALFALGHALPVVMAEIGHADPKVTLGIYAHVMRRGPEAKAALRALVEGREWAPMGTSSRPSNLDATPDPSASRNHPAVAALPRVPQAGVEPAAYRLGGGRSVH